MISSFFTSGQWKAVLARSGVPITDRDRDRSAATKAIARAESNCDRIKHEANKRAKEIRKIRL